MKRAAMLSAILMSAITTQGRAQSAPGENISVNQIIGDWDAAGSAFHPDYQPFLITASKVRIGKCRDTSYTVIRNCVGVGPGAMLRGDSKDNWRDIAIELKPRGKTQSQCLEQLLVKVLEFSIPMSMVCHVDIAMFRARAEFDMDSRYYGTGGFGNKNCAH
jgi:hypothetical protein